VKTRHEGMEAADAAVNEEQGPSKDLNLYCMNSYVGKSTGVTTG
jgi:hypothetical protein